MKDFVKNYWPWLPFAVIGLLQCGRRAFLQQDRIARVLFLWVVVVLGIMSLSTNQTL
ncbi:MAG: phospholipid carrier-dependent glycosyltransferase, partial [Nitrospinaceae bacterium]|nr:phospholipid carrier-dependent glycosyltransferase [Nitrospinaceae bacterium]